MLTVQDVANIFRVTRKAVYQWINAGKIKAIRIGGVIRITEEEVERIKRGESEKQ